MAIRSDGRMERPIGFTSQMVRAALAGRKTQTRRPVKHYRWRDDDGWPMDLDTVDTGEPCRLRCPYGEPGDVLWVRETWGCRSALDHLPPREIDRKAQIHYKAHFPRSPNSRALDVFCLSKWRSPRFMPRWASRTDLLVIDRRAERVQEITDDDARAEGVDGREDFSALWNDIYGKRGLWWDLDPLVWVVSFEMMYQEGEG